MWYGDFSIYHDGYDGFMEEGEWIEGTITKVILPQDKVSDVKKLFNNNSFYIESDEEETTLRVSDSEDPNNIYELFETVNKIYDFLLKDGYELKGGITWKGSIHYLTICIQGGNTELRRTRPW